MRIRTKKATSAIIAMVLVAGGLLATAIPAHAAAIIVDSLVDSTVNDGACTLREAITNANDDAATWVDCATGAGADTITFLVVGTIVLGSELPGVTAAGGDLTIQGPGEALLTISGDTANDDLITPNVRLLSVGGGATLDLLGVTMSEGGGSGGGAMQNAGTLRILASTFADNRPASFGSGAISSGGFLSVTDSLFVRNIVVNGGAGAIGAGGTLIVSDSTFVDNEASAAGAIYISGPSATVTGTTFADNDGGAQGGAIYHFNNSGTVTITNSTFTGNTAGSGAAITTNRGMTITHSTISGNVPTPGGAIEVFDGSVTLRSTIIANNQAAGDVNCDVSNATVVDGGYNLDSGTSCGFAGTSLSSTDPVLGPLQDNGGPTETMALPGGSPAIDLIPGGVNDCGTTITTDQRGFDRPVGLSCDVGAYERRPPGGGLPPTTLTVEIVGTGAGSVTSAPAGITCPGDCTEPAALRPASAQATTFVLTAHPEPGSVFVRWAGMCFGTSTTCTITPSGDSFVAAWFGSEGTEPPPPPPPPDPGTHDLHATKVGRGRIASEPPGIACGPTCSYTYEEGSTVTLTATAREGWRLKRWRFGCKGQGETCTLLMDSNRRAEAVFVRT